MVAEICDEMVTEVETKWWPNVLTSPALLRDRFTSGRLCSVHVYAQVRTSIPILYLCGRPTVEGSLRPNRTKAQLLLSLILARILTRIGGRPVETTQLRQLG